MRSWKPLYSDCEETRKVVGRLEEARLGRGWPVGQNGVGDHLLPTEALLRFCVTWNTNSRHCHEAQAVLGVLLRHEAPEELLAYDGVRGALEALLPYTGM